MMYIIPYIYVYIVHDYVYVLVVSIQEAQFNFCPLSLRTRQVVGGDMGGKGEGAGEEVELCFLDANSYFCLSCPTNIHAQRLRQPDCLLILF